jgi:multimeric flavodoxin WrbA
LHKIFIKYINDTHTNQISGGILIKVLLINCSPVKNGATSEIINVVNSLLNTINDIRNICIDDYEIKFCKGCRTCHKTAKCIHNDDVLRVIEEYNRADIIISVAPSYWADIPGQFKVFIDRCTPWCNTHEPHATIGHGKKNSCIFTDGRYLNGFITGFPTFCER